MQVHATQAVGRYKSACQLPLSGFFPGNCRSAPSFRHSLTTFEPPPPRPPADREERSIDTSAAAAAAAIGRTKLPLDESAGGTFSKIRKSGEPLTLSNFQLFVPKFQHADRGTGVRRVTRADGFTRERETSRFLAIIVPLTSIHLVRPTRFHLLRASPRK